MDSPPARARLNMNVGILGHVDSGKTSLGTSQLHKVRHRAGSLLTSLVLPMPGIIAIARALSTTASTAAFDKSPQSQARGITLDLGFSSFQTTLPDHLNGTRRPTSRRAERRLTRTARRFSLH